MLQEKEWFAGNCDRKTAEDFLLQINKVGNNNKLEMSMDTDIQFLGLD